MSSIRSRQSQVQAARSARASSRAAKISILGISLVVLLGFIVASAAFSVFSNVQYLSELTRQHVRLWREIERTTTYVLGAREERPLPPSVAEKMQSKVTALLIDEQKINAEIKAKTAQTRSLRRLLVSKDQEEGAIADAVVDREIRLQIERFTKSVPAVIATGFSAWSSVSDLKLRSGVALKPLVAREDALAGIKQRIINATWVTFFTIVAIVLSSIWLFWVLFPVAEPGQASGGREQWRKASPDHQPCPAPAART